MTRRWRADSGVALLCIVIALLVLWSAPSSAKALTVGVATDLTWGIPRSDIDRTVAALRKARVGSIRLNVSWTGIEPKDKGQINPGYLADVDYAVARARAAGIDILMQVGDSAPYWASADPARHRDADGPHWDRAYRPRDMDDYGDFAAFVARRYAARGVRAFEIWNEPNHPRFWPSGPEPAEYVQLLAAGHRAIKAAAPHATVVLGGLSSNDRSYLEALYEAGAARHFDVAAVHPYTGAVRPGLCWREPGGALAADAFCGIEEIRRTMVARGDAGKPIWITEFGWSTYDGRYGVSEAQQARYLTDAIRRLRRYRWVTRAYWYGFRNTWFRAERRTDPDAHYGLLRADFTPKPAYSAYRRATDSVGSRSHRPARRTRRAR